MFDIDIPYHCGKMSVIGALGMSVDEVESMSHDGTNAECVEGLEMVCASDSAEASVEAVIMNICLPSAIVDNNKHDSGYQNIESIFLENGLCNVVKTTNRTVYRIEPKSSIGSNFVKQYSSKPQNPDVVMSVDASDTNGRAVGVDTSRVQHFAEKGARGHPQTKVSEHSCYHCSKTFRHRSHLLLHMKQHTHDNVTNIGLTCNICGRKFQTSSGLRKHRPVHDNIQRYRCAVCSKSFAFESVLREHAQIHSDSCSFVCEFCGRGFKHVSNMLKHRRLMHVHQERSSCQRCGTDSSCMCEASGAEFLTSDQFQCPICWKCFTSKSYKEMHLRVHTGNRPFKCQMCDYSFKQQSNLSKHLLTVHSTGQGFSCRFCGKTFALNSNCKDHEKIHTEDRKFHCALCSKRFITAAALRAHDRTHANAS